MTRPRGGRHRNPADSRRRMFLAIILAFAISSAATSLWALDPPLDETSNHTEGSMPPKVGESPTAADSLPDFQVDDASIRSQEPEEPSSASDPTDLTETAEPEPDQDGDNGGGDGAEAPGPDDGPEEEVLDLVNDRRSEAGCGALDRNDRLDTAARLHAEDMAANDYFDHRSQDGRSPTDRAAEQGFGGGVGENIAAGYPDAAAVMEGWMNSQGHRDNILNCGYSVIGVGIADRDGTIYWVQNFG